MATVGDLTPRQRRSLILRALLRALLTAGLLLRATRPEQDGYPRFLGRLRPRPRAGSCW